MKQAKLFSVIMAALIFIFCFLWFVVYPVFSQQGDCHGCKRRATLSEFNIHDPDNCFKVNDKNGNISPEAKEAIYVNNRTRLSEWFHSDCFSIQMTKSHVEELEEKIDDVEGFGSRWKFPEYTFKLSFTSGLPGTEMHPENGRPIVSRFDVSIYFLGESEELVHTWTVFGALNTDRTGQLSGSGHSSGMGRLIRSSTPIADVLWAFEKMPRICSIKPEKNEVLPEEEIKISLSGFRDLHGEKSREFNRILVAADQGEILNGKNCHNDSNMKVFRLDEVPIQLLYKAPRKCDEDLDRITVFNSCEILSVDKVPLAGTQQYKKIGEVEIGLTLHEWSGRLSIEQARTCSCHLKDEEKGVARNLKISEELVQRAEITLTSDDFDLARIPAAGAVPEPIEVSGSITCSYLQDRLLTGEAKSTDCIIKAEHKKISPGNWSRDHHITTGEASHPVNVRNVRILFSRDSAADEGQVENMRSRMKELAQQAKTAAESQNMARVQEIQGEMARLKQGGGGDSIPLRIRVMVNVPARDDVMLHAERKIFDACLGRMTKDDSKSDSRQIQLVLPIMVELKGPYIKGKDGSDRIEAKAQDIGNLPNSWRLGDQKCPDKETRLNASLTLERKRK